MVPVFLSIASRWATRATSRGTVHLALPAVLVIVSMLYGGWEFWRRVQLGAPQAESVVAPSDTTVVFGPQRFDAPLAKPGDRAPIVSRFPTEVALDLALQHRYLVRLTNGAPDGTGRVSNASIDGRTMDAQTGVLTFELTTRAVTVLDIAIQSQPTPGHLTLEVLDVTGGTLLVFGMERFARPEGRAVSFTRSFTVDANVGAPFHLWVVNGNADGTARLAEVAVSLNGALIPTTLSWGTATTMTAVTPVVGPNELEIVLPAQGAGFVEIGITATDAMPPLLTITAPVPGLLTRDTVVSVTGTVTDGSAVSVTVNGLVATRSGSGFAATVALLEGENVLAIAAVDAAGVRTDSARVVVRDRTAPTLIVTAPVEGFVTQAAITVSGSVTDAGTVTVTANSVPLPVDAAGAFTGSIPLAAGSSVVAVTATDAAGNGHTVVRMGAKQDDVVLLPFGGMQLTYSMVAQEAFTGTGALSGNWTAFDDAPERADGMMASSDEDDNLAFWDADAFSPDQYSQIVLGANAEEVGVAVRVSGTDMADATAYLLELHWEEPTELGLWKYVDATWSSLATYSDVAMEEGDTLRLEIMGATLRFKINGVQIGADVTDTDLATGAAGFFAGNAANQQADNWEGGDISAQTGDGLAQEAFTGTGALSGNWTAFDTPALRDGDMLRGNSSGRHIAFWDAEEFHANQYSQLILGENPDEVGVAVRVSGTALSNVSAYWLEVFDADSLGLHKYVTGSSNYTLLAVRTGLSMEPGDVIRLEVNGARLRIKLNGQQLGTLVSDADLDAGAPGFVTGTSDADQGDFWEGGNLMHTGSALAREAFTGNGDLPSNWTPLSEPAVREEDMLRGNSNDNDFAYWNAAWFHPDQYSQVIIQGNAEEVGVAVRLSGESPENVFVYWLEYQDSSQIGLHKYVGGTENYDQIAERTGLNIAIGDTMRLEIEGSTLRIKINGEQLGAPVTDTDIETGAAGFMTGQPALYQADDWEGGDLSQLPPDPVAVAPPINQSTATSLAASTEFLYTGDSPIQTGVEPGTIEPLRAAVLRGRVFDRDDAPLPGVTIRVKDHPELGQTLSRADGWFDMAVNGGGVLTLDYTKTDFLPAQRQVAAPWEDYAIVDDVVLVQLDTAVTIIAFEDTVEVARGSVVADTFGTRRTTVLFHPGTTAQMHLPNGDSVSLTSMAVRATEYTVGDNGPKAMPAVLPSTSGYTYAVELSVDEAVDSAASVRFSQPVSTYLENYLGFPVGSIVPVGSYDRERGVWVPEPNGRVIKILTITSDTANLDIDGDAGADDSTEMAALGITPGERAKLADLYTGGQSLWRMPIKHFTAIDGNLPVDEPPDPKKGPRSGPGGPMHKGRNVDDPCTMGGSIIECQNQVLGERIAVTGTPYTLNYRSDRATGFGAGGLIDVLLTDDSIAPDLAQIEVGVRVAGRESVTVFNPPFTEGMQFRYEWDGRDAYERLVSGSQTAVVSLTYLFPQLYWVPASTAQAFGLFCPGSIIADTLLVPCDIDVDSTVPKRRVRSTQWGAIQVGPLSAWNAVAQGIGGWSLDVHHSYDPGGRLLFLGTGDRVKATEIRSPRVVAGNGSLTPGGNGGAATSAGFAAVTDVIAAPDGGFYVADREDHTVRHVRPDGVIEAFAGISGSPGFSGDGGPADSAELDTPVGLALGIDGSVYIADSSNFRVRRVAPNGTIETFAGTGTDVFSGEDTAATAAGLVAPVAVTVSPDGSVYIADAGDTARVRKVSTDGRIVTIAGAGTDPEICVRDSIPAGVTCLTEGVVDITWGANNALYVLQETRLDRIGSNGVMIRVAGDDTPNCFSSPGDDGPARDAGLCPTSVAVTATGEVLLADRRERLRVIELDGRIRALGSGPCALFDGPIPDTRRSAPRLYASIGPIALVQENGGCLKSVAVAPDGSLLMTDEDRVQVVRLQTVLPGLSLSSMVIASPDGGELYIFSSDGRHLETRNALTNATILTFDYDSTGRLVTIIDADSNVTTIERDGLGTPTAIVGPFGAETELTMDNDGYLASVENPAGEIIEVEHNDKGLLLQFVNPLGDTTAFTYNGLGQLIGEEDAIGAELVLERDTVITDYASLDSTIVTLTSREGRETRYEVSQVDAQQGRRTLLPTGLEILTSITTNSGKGLVQTTTETPDGMRTTVTTRRDPRFPAAAIFDSMEVLTTTDVGMFVWASRSVELDDPDDPLSLLSQTDSVTVNGKTTVSVYTASTRTQLATTPEGRQFLTRLDSLGRVIRARHANLDTVKFSYDGAGRLEEQQQGGRIVSYGYGADGRLASVTDPLGRETQLDYDSAGRVTSQVRPDGSEILFAYDSTGNLTSLTPPGRPAHGFQYNAVGLVTQYDPPTIAAGAKPTKYFYNFDRQLDSIVRPDSITVALGYDAAGRPNAVSFDRGTLTLGYSNTTGNLNRIRTPEGDSLLYSYNGSLPTQVRWSGAVDGTVGVGYDDDFQVVTQTVNSANSVSFVYDQDGLLTNAGALVLARNTTNGLLLADTLGLVHSDYQYSARGELSGYRVKHDATTLFATGYVRDSLGRIVQLFDTTQGTPKRWSFVYDSLGRLVKDSVNGAVFHVFTYDSNGNRLSYTSGAGTVNYFYDNQDRLLWSRVGTDTTHYRYGSNGELKLRIAPGADTTTYTYDAFGNLISIVLPDATEIEYVIDGQNRRVGRKVDGDLVQSWLYQSKLTPVAELDSAGAVVSRFIYGSRSNVPDYMLRGDSVFRLVADHLGSVRLVVDTASGTVVQRLEYDEWGNVTTNTNAGFQPFGFAGGLYDAETGLVRYGARDYDAQLGRWTVRDPVRFTSGTTNLYSYVDSDPVSKIDPTGLDFWLTWHDAGGGFYHVAIWWQPGSDFDPSAFSLTFGAGPEGASCLTGLFGRCLNAGYNRPGDIGKAKAGCIRLVLPDGLSEYEMLERLFQLQAHYFEHWNGRIPYRLFLLNSNSYARGLAEAAGFKVPSTLPTNAPAWGNPLAPEAFGR